MKSGLLILLLAFVASCTPPDEVPLVPGTDACAYCRMGVADGRYGAELITNKGKVFKYDATECMVSAIMLDKSFKENEIHRLLVVDFARPGHLVTAKTAVFLHSEQLPSPMGAFITAFANDSESRAAKETFGGTIMSWDEMSEMVMEQNR